MMTNKLLLAYVPLLLLNTSCKQLCVPDFECQDTDTPIDTDVDTDTDTDSDSDSDSDIDTENEETNPPFIWKPLAVCEDGMWIFSVELREVQTDKVWVEVYRQKGEQEMMTLFPLYKMENNVWRSYWSEEDYDLRCDRDYWLSFVAENSNGSDRLYWQYTFSE